MTLQKDNIPAGKHCVWVRIYKEKAIGDRRCKLCIIGDRRCKQCIMYYVLLAIGDVWQQEAILPPFNFPQGGKASQLLPPRGKVGKGVLTH